MYAKGAAAKVAAAPDIGLGLNYLAGTLVIAALISGIAWLWTRPRPALARPAA